MQDETANVPAAKVKRAEMKNTQNKPESLQDIESKNWSALDLSLSSVHMKYPRIARPNDDYKQTKYLLGSNTEVAMIHRKIFPG